MRIGQIWLKAPIQRSRFHALGQFTYRYRRWIIAPWAFLMMLALTVAPLLEQVLTETGAVYQQGPALVSIFISELWSHG